MATVTESSEDEKPNVAAASDTVFKSQSLEDGNPWIDNAVQQVMIYRKIVEESIDSAIEASRSRLSQTRLTASVHFQQTLDYLQDVKSEYAAYEDAAVGKVKEGIHVAASHPFITAGGAIGLGSFLLKRPRHFLYYNTLRLFASEESLLSRADTKVKQLRQSIDRLKAESEKLEKVALVAEDELIRGRTKLRQAGKQIQGVINSAYKIERQAAGLKDIVGELPRREASRFRSQVSNIASEAKRERNALTKEVSKISNYGISV
ncbi:Alanine-tRNA ligase [Citrus sinensis]|uniref:Uncharacterized protein n=3 Tax=Citrus TaxID=2706 RepID=A0A067H0Z7_CITSI|nr:uncharacterized protein LOC18047825 [Citrus x clementina]XP_052294618.1 RGS1-HXK1-interacting protein 1 [Citrus sinensis]ESR58577.1 hypothetical protein CICLE_v10021755mg [Citrus x clementina]KAH9733258.1 Alanine-tRNA ligase [Citrus sinensis]KAH9788481.1 Alanine-tRNA ligase [Citrus sinensis]KDO85658.1 hypothetical protein CISIN_1g024845mg [Citrus sinensis]